MNTFEFLHRNLASILLPKVTNDIVTDCSRTFKASHLLKSGKKGRLSGWAIVKEGQLIVQSDLMHRHPNLLSGDKRTRFQAWHNELENFKPPVCFLEFTQSTINLNNVYLTHDLRVVLICGPSSSQRFNYLEEPGDHAPRAHITLYKEKMKHAV